MTAAPGTAMATGTPPASETLRLYRDDGPLAELAGAVLGRVLRVPPIALVVAGAAPLVGVLALAGDAPEPALAGCVALLVVVVGAGSDRAHSGRFDWAVPALLRAVEYGALTWLAVLSSERTVVACFALLGVLAFRHYDVVYRVLYRGAAPPRWARLLGGGWDGRLIVATALFVAGALYEGLIALAAVLAVVSVGESVASLLRSREAPTHPGPARP